MTIVRAPRPTSGFTLIRDSVLRDDRLSYRARGVLAAILSRPDNWATTADRLAAEGREGRDAVRSAMDELAAYGYLERRNVQVDAGRWIKQIIVYDQPSDARSEEVSPTTDSQASVTGNPPPTTDFQASANQASVFQASKREDRELQPTTPTGSEAPADPVDNSAQNLVAEWVDHCNGGRPPNRVIGQIAKEIGAMLTEGIPYNDVRAGLAQWHTQGLHPSTLASVVHEIRNPKKVNGAKHLQPAEDARSIRLRSTPDPIPPPDLTPAETNRWLRDARRHIAAGEKP